MDDSFFDLNGHGIKVAGVTTRRKVEIKLQHTYLVTIEGEATTIELYSYKVAWRRKPNFRLYKISDMLEFGDIVKAFKVAIKDGVDVISIDVISIVKPKLTSLYAAVGSYLAMKANILTVAACSNAGPVYGSVRNTAPWILTVGASLSDKRFVTTVEIDNEKFEGSSFNPSETKWRPLIDFPCKLRSSHNLKSAMHSPVTSEESRELLSKGKKRLKKLLKGK
nr:cucumisin [Quercus suber]